MAQSTWYIGVLRIPIKQILVEGWDLSGKQVPSWQLVELPHNIAFGPVLLRTAFGSPVDWTSGSEGFASFPGQRSTTLRRVATLR